MAYSKKEREQYNQNRARVCLKLGIRELDYNAFRRIGQALREVYENECNGLYTEEEYSTLTYPLENKAHTLARKLELYVYFQTDPRGATIYLDRRLILPDRYVDASCIY